MSESYTPKRKRGRPTNAERAARQAAEQEAEAQTKTAAVEVMSLDDPPAPEPAEKPSKRAEATRRGRRRRSDTSATAGLKLHVPSDMLDPNYEYRFITDDADFGDEGQRVGQRMHAKTKLDDWDLVMSDTGIDGQGEGTPIKRRVGKNEAGRPNYGYLCRKPKDWYDEDKAKEQKLIDEREESMRRGTVQGPEGLSGPQAYIPAGGIKIGQGN